jgi:hypothetical protein
MPQIDFDRQLLKKYIKKISGQDYLTVAGRIVAGHNSGQLIGAETACDIDNERGKVLCRSAVMVLPPNWKELPEAAQTHTYTGYAESPLKGGRNAEGTNPIEVAETSAIGRALGFAGFGVMESIASADEVEVAQARQAATVTAAQKKALLDAATKTGVAKDKAELEALAQEVHGKPLSDLTAKEVTEWTAVLNPNGSEAKAPF